MKYRILFGLLLSCLAFVATAAPSWQLNTGYYTPAKMPMTVVFPRPDSETNSWARNRIAYADGVMQYRIPIAIQGGAYPFHFELIAGPSGMAIGQDFGDPNYGIVTWTPTSEGGPYTVTVRVYDQDYRNTNKSIDITWTVTADNSKFIFIDPKASTNGSGTKSSPFNTMKGIAVPRGTGSNPLYGKAVIFRAGTTNFYGPESDGAYKFNSNDQNPCVFLGYTGENAQIDMSTGAFRNAGQPDVYFGELTLKNAQQNVTLSGETVTVMYFDWSDKGNRVTFFENAFQNLTWSGNGSNNAAIVSWNPTVWHQYWAVIGNSIENSSVSLVDTFATKYMVIDNNRFLANVNVRNDDNGGMNIKSDMQNLSIRGNISTQSTLGDGGLVRVENQAQIFPNDNIEVAYNLAIMPSVSLAAMWQLVLGASNSPNIYVYRNTFVGDVKHYDHGATIRMEKNVIISNDGFYGIDAGRYTPVTNTQTVVIATDITQDSLAGNLYGTTGDGLTDQNGMLIGSASSKYFGKVGYQISNGNPLLSAPTWK